MRNIKLKEIQAKVIETKERLKKAEEQYAILMKDTFDKFFEDQITEEAFFKMDVRCIEETNKTILYLESEKAKNELIKYCELKFKSLGMMDKEMEIMFETCQKNLVRRSQLVEILMKF